MKPVCMNCGEERKQLEFKCSNCGGLFELVPDFKFREEMNSNFPYVREWVNLGEVETPLVERGNLSFKLDYFTPTFSYKDRGAHTLISYFNTVRNEFGIKTISEDSSGNAGASIAAYGTAADFSVNIFVPEKTSQAKVDQIGSYGANIIKVQGTREDVQTAAEASEGVFASHVKMPEFRDGIRTLAYELFNQLGGNVPDHVFVPVSAGTLLLGMHSGFEHLLESGEIDRIPDIVSVQTEAVSPLYSRINGTPFDSGRKITSVADALVSTNPPLLEKMVEIASRGHCVTVSEEEIILARNDLSRSGFYVEYSSATVLAAYRKRDYSGRSVLVLTGNGLKNQPVGSPTG